MKTVSLLAALALSSAVCGSAFAAAKPATHHRMMGHHHHHHHHVLTKGSMKKKVTVKKATEKVVTTKQKGCGTYAYWHKKHKKCWDARYNAAKV